MDRGQTLVHYKAHSMDTYLASVVQPKFGYSELRQGLLIGEVSQGVDLLLA